ncbi:MAG: hypothetical protein AB7O28_16475 [Vicinamibacterales bacterium]
MRRVMTVAVAWVAAAGLAGSAGIGAAPAESVLSGAWTLNRDLSAAPGGTPVPDGGMRGRGGRRGGGPGGRGPGGGFGGGPGGFGGGGGRRGGGPAEGGRPSSEDMEARRALMQEVMELPARFTIAQDGDRLSMIEPDGVVRTYVANGQAEKHALTSGTIETRSRWDGTTLRMEIRVGDRMAVVRTFAVQGDDPRRLDVRTTFDGAPKDRGRLAVYDEEAR